MSLVEIKGISKRYYRANVLNHVDMEINEGEFVALIGRSGSGKSTLLRILGGLEPPDAGLVQFAGREISNLNEQALSEFRRQSVGFVFQAFNLVDTLTVAENVAITLHLNGIARSAIRTRVSALLASLDISEHADKLPDTLSGGEQQRVAIARALAHKPRLIIADEPTGNLDDETALFVMQLLTEECERQHASLIVATHSDEVKIRADRTLQLVGGSIHSAP